MGTKSQGGHGHRAAQEPSTAPRASRRPAGHPVARRGFAGHPRKPESLSGLVAYLRVSTDGQNNGPEVQRQAIEAYAAARSLPVVSWHEDRGVSGATPAEDRPGLSEALGALRPGLALVVHKRDRLARDVVIATVVDRLAARLGDGVLCADGAGNGSGPEAALMRAILDAFSAFERALIRARTRAALAAKRVRSEATSSTPPYGWRKVGKMLEPVPEHQATRARILALRDDGLGFKAIGRLLEADGIPAPEGGVRWFGMTVKRVCDYPG